MLNSALASAARRIMGANFPNSFFVTARFFNSNEEGKFSFSPFQITRLSKRCDYLQNWGDEIDLQMKVSPKDYALMQDQGQDLMCIVTFTYVTKDGKMVFTPAPIQKLYHVLINNPRDIRKAAPDLQNYTEASVDMSVRLMEETVYKLRQMRVNTIFQSSSILEAIHGITTKFDIKRIEMVPPDNIHRYDHIDFPSYQGIDSVYQYLHSKFGIYEKGANSYITDGVLYIYPPFETDPDYYRTAIFHQVPTGEYAGSTAFHKVEGDNISVVVNTQPESYDLSIVGAEEVGTGFVFTRASRATDGVTQADTSKGAMYTEQPALTISLNNGRTAVKNQNNIRHVRTTDNPYPDMSQIMAYQGSIMQVMWQYADPFQLDPGHAVAYYYDENQVMVKKTGILQGAVYEFQPMPQTNTLPMFGVVAQLELRLAPNTTTIL